MRRPALVRFVIGLVLVGQLAAACASGPIGPVSPDRPSAQPGPGQGDVARQYPELSVESSASAVRIELLDPAAQAWQIRIVGAGDLAGRGLELVVETADVDLRVEIRRLENGGVVDVDDLTGLAGDPTMAAGGCDPVLGICFDAASITLPADGDGRLIWHVERLAAGALEIGGSSATYAAPFTPGPWRETESVAIGG